MENTKAGNNTNSGNHAPGNGDPGSGRSLIRPLQEFLHTEVAGGIVLLVATIVALAWANSPWDGAYVDLWHRPLSFDTSLFRVDEDLGHLVNDGLMAIFFFVVGLEIKRELVSGELATPRKALLPVAAALGGMLVPAAIYLAFNSSGDGAKGWGIPMATDIAFALGVLAMLGRRVPLSLKVFLLALAIVDDLGAILVIAVFYSDGISLEALTWAGVVIVGVIAAQRAGVQSVNIYLVLGVLLWVAVLKSGIHATIAGVVLALLTPSKPLHSPAEADRQIEVLLERIKVAEAAGQSTDVYQREIERVARDAASPLNRLESVLHPWASFVIIPIFALANAGLPLSGEAVKDAVSSRVGLGIGAGLILGKFAGITIATWLVVRLGLAELPPGLRWRQISGAALLAGIGFTVSLFITGLAFSQNPDIEAEAKIGILIASAMAGIAGYTWLRLACKEELPKVEAEGLPA